MSGSLLSQVLGNNSDLKNVVPTIAPEKTPATDKVFNIHDLSTLDTLDDLVMTVAGESIYTYAFISPQSKQSTSFGNGHAFTKPSKRKYLEELKCQLDLNWNKLLYFDCPVKVICIISKTKKNLKQEEFKSTRPDCDNLMKPINDCLGRVLKDDSRIVYPQTIKIYSKSDFVFVKVTPVKFLGLNVCLNK